MAKRFTDTTKWDKSWFFDLPPKMKLAWCYLCDNCNSIGVWPLNLKVLSFFVGEKISEDDLKNYLSKNIIWIDTDKILLPGYVPFQYKNLNPLNKAHDWIIKSFISACKGIEDLPAEAKNIIDNFKSGFKTLKRPSKDPLKIAKKSKHEKFIEPTVEEVKKYVKDKNLNMSAEDFFDHFESNGWKVGGKARMKNWHAAARKWARRNYDNKKTNMAISKGNYSNPEFNNYD